MAQDFRLSVDIDLIREVIQTKQVILAGRKRPQDVTEKTEVHAGTLVIEMNL
jgi:hypothetical protein